MKRIALCIALTLAACGGGGGSGGNDMRGRWAGDLFLTSNTCAFQVTDNEGVALRVNIDGTRVVMDGTRGGVETTLEGSTIDGGVRASRKDTVPCTNGTSAQMVSKFEIMESGDTTFTASFGQCSPGLSGPPCEYVRQGTFTKTD